MYKRQDLDRVENDELLVILGTTRDTLIVTKPVMLELAPMQMRQTADQVKADFSVVEIPHNPPLLNSGVRETLIVTKPVKLELAPMQIRQTPDQVKAHFSVVEIPHNPLYETVTGT